MNEFRNKPFYLKKNNSNMRVMIISAIVVALIGIANPYFLIVLPILIAVGLKGYLNSKKPENIDCDRAVESYLKGDFSECSRNAEHVHDINPQNEKASILLGLIKYEHKDYEKAAELFETIPQQKINLELDLNLKLAETYLNLGRYEKAEKILKELLKLQPNSEYIKERLNRCSTKA